MVSRFLSRGNYCKARLRLGYDAMNNLVTILFCLLAFVVSASGQNLVAEWNMADGTGTTVADSSGNSQPLTITPGSGGWTTQTGLSSGAYNFDGTTTVMQGPATGMNFDYNQPWTIAWWFNTSKTLAPGATQTFYSRRDSTNHNRGLVVYMGYDTYFTGGWYVYVRLTN